MLRIVTWPQAQLPVRAIEGEGSAADAINSGILTVKSVRILKCTKEKKAHVGQKEPSPL